MLMMRLKRVGRKNNPSYRIIVVDKRASVKSNNFVDTLGYYEPKQGKVSIDGEKAKYWLGCGVQASGTVYNILVSEKVVTGKKINVLPKKAPIIDEAKLKAEAEAAAKAEAEAVAAKEAAAAAAPAPEVEAPTETETTETTVTA